MSLTVLRCPGSLSARGAVLWTLVALRFQELHQPEGRAMASLTSSVNATELPGPASRSDRRWTRVGATRHSGHGGW